jgi:type IV pilus assembly protein PilC
MKKFFYKARDKQGKVVTGEVEAPDPQKAAKLVRSKGLIVVSINTGGLSVKNLTSSFRNRVGRGDVTSFTRQLATMVNAGLPITESLAILRLQAKANMSPIISQILADIEGGDSLSSALRKHPHVFGSTYIALIKAGETGGVIEKVLDRMADNMEKSDEFRSKVKGALIYPAIIVIGMIFVSLIMIVFVIPKMTELYDQFGAELPLPTKILLGISDVVLTLWPVILAALVVGIWAFRAWRKTPSGKRTYDKFYLKLPILGSLQKEVLLTELTRTLSLVIGAGVPILEGLTVISDVISNSLISDALKDSAKQIEKGFPIAFAFAKHPEAFPVLLSQMISVGEETGKMDEVLEKVSHVFEMESETKVKALTSAIEPLIMIFLGVGVAFLVIAIILPIYNLTSAL